ncbi:MAG: ABC transporter permease [Parachlamydiales bacterium]|nr:ABC transporter permease [Parachlamydiales bacterium]
MNEFLKFFQTHILIKMFQHLQLCFYSLFIAILIAVPLGIFLARLKSKIFSSIILRSAAILQTIPGIALIALIVAILVFIRSFFENTPATGFLPAIIVLSLYALLPILSNTYSGIKQVDPTMKDVAKGLGMTSRQILFSVELPLSLSLIIAGIRISLVWTVGMATLTSLVGSGGLGDLIMQGLRSMQIQLILAGTIPAAFLALIFDWLLSFFDRWVSLKTLR